MHLLRCYKFLVLAVYPGIVGPWALQPTNSSLGQLGAPVLLGFLKFRGSYKSKVLLFYIIIIIISYSFDAQKLISIVSYRFSDTKNRSPFVARYLYYLFTWT